MIPSSLRAVAGHESVSNVLLYISDSLRYDYLPEKVQSLGVTAKAVAPSTFTASSLPSILSGKYPATHGVWGFDDQLESTPPLLGGDLEIGFDAEEVWIKLDAEDKPPLRIHRLSEERALDEVQEPFVHVVHDVGPHAPYGFKNGVFDSTKSFFDNHENQREKLVELYEKDCSNSAERFLKLYDRLRADDILEDTLVIYTSDHGEALGERCSGGRFGHGHPMSPETVYIPIVFMGAGLPEGQRYTPLLSGTDIAPTALSAQGRAIPDEIDGTDLWTDFPKQRTIRSDVWQHIDLSVGPINANISVYAATSAWERHGGVVFNRKSKLERVGATLYDNLFRGYSPAWRGNLTAEKALNLLLLGAKEEIIYGSPAFNPDAVRESVPSDLDDCERKQGTALNDDQQEQLQDLGYL